MVITLRPVERGDDEFLFSVYASTRTEEMAMVDWAPLQKESFLRMQFNAQHDYYVENYPHAEFQIIVLNGHPAGRLYIHRREDEIRIMDISILPEHRGKGIGSLLLQGILEEGNHRCLPVTIHVERFNPALHFYKRLGFEVAEDKSVYYFMKWMPVAHEQHA